MHRSILVTFRSRGKPPLPTTTPAVVSTVHVEKSQLAAMWSEMAMFESSGKRGRGLELVCRYLLSIPPSSVDAERAFSVAYGVLCTKVQSRLSEN